MFCTSCGKQLEEKSKYCKYCGTRLIHEEEKIFKEASQKGVPQEEGLSEEAMEEPGMQNTERRTEDVREILKVEDRTEDVKEIKKAENMTEDKAEGIPEVQKAENITEDAPEIQKVDSSVIRKNSSKNRKHIAVAAVVVIVLCVILGGSVYAYRSYLENKAELVVRLFDEGDYGTSRETYEAYCANRTKLKNSVNQELALRIDKTRENYDNKTIDYDTARAKLEAISEYGGEVLHGEAVAAIGWLDAIQHSRENFDLGQEYMETEEYEKAIDALSLVVQEDSENYNKASQQIVKAQQELKEIQEKQEEEARINELRETTLQLAEAFTKTYEYKAAVETIQQGLETLPDDEILLSVLEYYQELYNMTEHVQDIKDNTYEYVYQEEELDILTVHITVPEIEGDIESYQKINDIFQTLQDSYIESCAKMAEEVSEYARDEFFYTHSLDMGYSVMYNKNSILCILVEVYEYLGGAHGSPYRITYVFDIASGEQLMLEDLITLDESEFFTYAAAAFEDLIGQNPEEYWEDAIDTVYNTEGYQFLYYLTEEGLVLYYYPYELSNYARGFVEVLIPFDGHEELFGFLE